MEDYGLLYSCPFESNNGHQFKIEIYKRGYDGASSTRHLGASPQLRQDKNGSICGTSLQFNLEAVEDNEFHNLFTSDAREYKVRLISDRSIAWVGYISPELYSEPDIAPPYDVALTATDGLGELKNYDFDITNAILPLNQHLQKCLELTGLDMKIAAISTLRDNDEDMTIKEFFEQSIDLSFMEDKTYYDVLSMLMDTINASIRLLDGNKWLIMRETDLAVNADGNITPDATFIDVSTSGDMTLPTIIIGAMGEQDYFPIGFLNNEVSPASNKITIISDNHYKSILVNSNMDGDYGWMRGMGVTFDTDHYTLGTNAGILAQNIIMDGGYPYAFLLSIDARCSFNSQHDDPQDIDVCIELMSGNTAYYFTPNNNQRNNISYVRNESTRANRVFGGNWSTGNMVWHKMQLQAAVNDNEDDIETVEYSIQIPRPISGRGGLNPSEITVYIRNGGTYYDELVYRAELTILDQRQGTKTIVNLNNNAREAASDVNILVPYNTSRSLNMPKLLMGLPVSADYGLSDLWKTSKFDNAEYNALMALDYAQARAVPRWIKRGKINIPDTTIRIDPVCQFDSHISGRPSYIVNTYIWDLVNDEAEIEMVSLPTGNVSVNSIKVVTTDK